MQRVLGMSKLMYLVATGLLETILPALLNKLDPNAVVAAVWDRERFKQEMQPHLQQILRLVDPQVAKVFGRLLVVREAVRLFGGDGVSCVETTRATEAAEGLSLKLNRGSELEAMSEMVRVVDTEGVLVTRAVADGRSLLTVPVAQEAEAEVGACSNMCHG
eukprot:Gregarina_sp_Poly_1__10850@NODE_841_length_6022_cov_31_299244_g608_i0_p3_GENE_NODE_841_length_6022_cov_31_299244_g608_i0NODE_841_length_6022_cov_31_299244_g608_i0_p3_ORF_typecomplete_len161_score27_73_NODE_841_length_6022_cov_31_299244_g608_i0516998